MTLPGYARGALLLFGTSLVGIAPTQADEGRDGTLWLDLPDCATPPYQPEQLLHAVDVELSPERLSARVEEGGRADTGPRVVLRVSSCDPQADSLAVQIWSSEGRFLGARSIALLQIEPTARARTVALLITDALRPPRLPEGATPSEASELASDPFGPTQAAASAALPRSSAQVHDDPLPETDDPYPQPPSLRVGLGAHARLLAGDSDLLLGLEVGFRGRLLGPTEWAVEGSYSQGSRLSLLRARELAWWNGAVGVDFVASKAPHLSFGPRLALARVDGSFAAEDPTAYGVTQERAVVVTLGARASLSARLWRRTSMLATLELSHSLYQTPLTDRGEYLPWYGWALTWGMGVSFGP
jgi:hypothetical protein